MRTIFSLPFNIIFLDNFLFPSSIKCNFTHWFFISFHFFSSFQSIIDGTLNDWWMWLQNVVIYEFLMWLLKGKSDIFSSSANLFRIRCRKGIGKRWIVCCVAKSDPYVKWYNPYGQRLKLCGNYSNPAAYRTLKFKFSWPK